MVPRSAYSIAFFSFEKAEKQEKQETGKSVVIGMLLQVRITVN